MNLVIATVGLMLVAAAPATTAPRTVSAGELQELFKRCAPTVAPETMAAVVRVESGGNPFAIGVVSGRLERQPENLEEAVATAEALERAGRNFSIGLVQVNRYNLSRFGLTCRTGFDPCANLRAGSKLLEECYLRARSAGHPDPLAAAVSCYYSGGFSRGFQSEPDGQASYVGLVLRRPDRTPSAVVGEAPERPDQGTQRSSAAEKPLQSDPNPSKEAPAQPPASPAFPAAPSSSTAVSPVVF